MNLIIKIGHSFRYAARGILFCVRHETNMRIHIIVLLPVLFFSQFYNLTKAEFVTLLITCVLVISTEMINTAIEVIIDKVSPKYSALAKVGKDVAAGAVFVTSFMAVIVGVVLFWDIETFKLIWSFMTDDISNLFLLLSYFVVGYLFINSGKRRKIKGKIK